MVRSRHLLPLPRSVGCRERALFIHTHSPPLSLEVEQIEVLARGSATRHKRNHTLHLTARHATRHDCACVHVADVLAGLELKLTIARTVVEKDGRKHQHRKSIRVVDPKLAAQVEENRTNSLGTDSNA